MAGGVLWGDGSRAPALEWSVLLGFVRLGTSPTIFSEPMSTDEAMDVVDGWLAQPAAVMVHPADRHATVLRGLLRRLGAAGNLTTDAHLAAPALEQGASLCFADLGFSRFRGCGG